MTRRRRICYKLSRSAAGCQGPPLSSASSRSGCSGGAGCWVTAVHVAANHCQTAWATGQLSMTWLRVASCASQAACGQRCDSGVPLWMCLWKAPTKSLPCSRRQTATRAGLSKAAEWAALHVRAHAVLEGSAVASEAMSVSSLLRAARKRCRNVGSSSCSCAGPAGAGSAGCGGSLSRTGAGRGCERCIQVASVERLICVGGTGLRAGVP